MLEFMNSCGFWWRSVFIPVYDVLVASVFDPPVLWDVCMFGNGESEVKNKLLSALLLDPISELKVKFELLWGPERP